MIYKLSVPGPIEDVEEVRVLEWHGEIGHVFEPDEMIVELETHKALVEVRAGQAGVLRAIVCHAGDWQQLGAPLAILSDTDDEPLGGPPESLGDWPVAFEVN